MPTAHAATLLFCHGGGFCKEVWRPIMARLQQTPLLQRVAVDMVAMDFPYHGAKRDVSQPATVDLDDPSAPRVAHPAAGWKVPVAAVQGQVQELRRARHERTPLIGIGHSMDGAALWGPEVESPGTFDGLVLFEPIVNLEDFPDARKSLDFFVAVTLKRRGSWDSFEQAEAELLSMRNFSRWHPEVLRSYIRGAVVRVSPANNVLDPESKFALSCHPLIEASFYSGGSLRMDESELAKPRCPTTFQYGARTQLFSPQHRQPLVDKFPSIYSIAEAVPNTSHLLVMEDPDACVSRTVQTLETLSPFTEIPSRL